MKRSLVRSVSVVIAILALMLATMAAPAFAGTALGGGADLVIKTLELNPGATCAYFVDAASGHTFIAIRTKSSQGTDGIILVGPVADSNLDIRALPVLLQAGIAGCVNAAG